MPTALTVAELRQYLSDPQLAETLAVTADPPDPFLVVDLTTLAAPLPPLIQPACVVIGITCGARPVEIPSLVDVVAHSETELKTLCAAIRATPLAALLLVQVLRHNLTACVSDGLLAESLAYSTLQHGAEFQRWLERQDRRRERRREERPAPAPASAEPVHMEREAACLRITLDRPAKRNAYSAAMRDALCNALALAQLDHRLRSVILAGKGPAFCAGGDLAEFGLARDAAVAHATRSTRNAGAYLHALRDRVTCHLHGACIGAGIELPAFTGRVRARADAFFQLPEVGMGLIPGAGGTVSITRRIGRLRTALLALTGQRLNAETALRWGLVDEIVDAFG
jgi:hypothetical protein